MPSGPQPSRRASSGEHRRLTKSVTRLGVITRICVGLLLLNGALGIGAVAGLVIFQLLFVVNVGRVIISQGIQ